MKSPARPGAAVALILAAAVLAGCSIDIAADLVAIGDIRKEDTRVQTFDARGLTEMEASINNGSITVESWSRPEVEVTLEKQVRASTEDLAAQLLDQLDVRWELDGTVLRGRVVEPDRSMANGLRTRLIIRAPRELALTLATRNGALTADGLNGRLTLKTWNGRIEVRGDRSTEPVELETRNGSIELTGYAGGGQLETLNGSIAVELVDRHGARFSLDTANGSIVTPAGRFRSGDIQYTWAGGGPRFRVSTRNGSIHLTVPTAG